MVEMTELLMERKADYSQVHDKVSRTMVKDPVILNHKPLLNGDFEFLGRQYRSSSECSSDSNLDTLLEEADKIQSSKNGFREDAPAKKQVRFNMERNKEYYYSYAQGSDDNISCDLMSNVNFVDYMHENDDDDDFEDDEESEEDEEDEEDHTDRESSEDDSRVDKFGYLVDKSTPSAEVNNNSSDSSDIGVKSKKLNGITDSVNDFSDSVGEKFIENGPIDHQDVQNGKLYGEKRLLDLRTQVLHLESSLKAKQDSVENEMSNLSSKLKKTREDTKQEMDKFQKELEDRKRHYITEMEDIDRRREEQKRKFEEELEEFRNEKKLQERRQRYYEHEAEISQMEKDLNQRTQDAKERDKEIREYEEYLNRRHAVCNGKEEDLDVLQNELDTLAKELEAKKAKLLHKHQLIHQSSEEDMVVSTPPLKIRSSGRASIASKGVDLRIEELKSQNRQLLEELFTLKKACEGKDVELTELKEKLEVSENESKRLQQRTKHLETQLELARKSAELGTDSVSVDDIMRRTTQDMRRNSRIRPPRAVAPSSSVLSSSSPGFKLPRLSSNDSLGTKITSSTDSGKGTKESGMKGSKGFASKKNKDDGDGRHKLGTERTTSSLCVIM